MSGEEKTTILLQEELVDFFKNPTVVKRGADRIDQLNIVGLGTTAARVYIIFTWAKA